MLELELDTEPALSVVVVAPVEVLVVVRWVLLCCCCCCCGLPSLRLGRLSSEARAGEGAADSASAAQRRVVCRFLCTVLGVVEGVEVGSEAGVEGVGVGGSEFGEVFEVDGHVHCGMGAVELL